MCLLGETNELREDFKLSKKTFDFCGAKIPGVLNDEKRKTANCAGSSVREGIWSVNNCISSPSLVIAPTKVNLLAQKHDYYLTFFYLAQFPEDQGVQKQYCCRCKGREPHKWEYCHFPYPGPAGDDGIFPLNCGNNKQCDNVSYAKNIPCVHYGNAPRLSF